MSSHRSPGDRQAICMLPLRRNTRQTVSRISIYSCHTTISYSLVGLYTLQNDNSKQLYKSDEFHYGKAQLCDRMESSDICHSLYFRGLLHMRLELSASWKRMFWRLRRSTRFARLVWCCWGRFVGYWLWLALGISSPQSSYWMIGLSLVGGGFWLKATKVGAVSLMIEQKISGRSKPAGQKLAKFASALCLVM